MNLPRAFRRLSVFIALPISLFAAPPSVAPAINALGLDLYREQIKSANGSGVLLSPYSIASALAMTYVGADGVTRDEMQRVLRLPADPTDCASAFQDLAIQLADVVRASESQVANLRKRGGEATPLELSVANRLFVQKGYALRPAFVAMLDQRFNSPVATVNFRSDPTKAGRFINDWVAGQTHNRIRDLLPPGQPTPDTRLALVNALYLRAAWKHAFEKSATQPEPFHLTGATSTPVPTMREQRWYGYAKRKDYTVVALPYETGQLQFILLVPDQRDGLAALEKTLTPTALTDCTDLSMREVILHLPKFKLEPATLPLASALQTLGLSTAFDVPKGSANFDRMAPRKADDYLAIGNVFHKTWLSLDEHGTEAAAATVVTMVTFGMSAPRKGPPPVEVRADRPFMFAIQHVPSGACLFLGRVTDPR